MAYLQFDLEAKAKVPATSRLAGLSEGQLTWGLLELWEWCWTGKRDLVTTEQLAGLFGGDGARTGKALAAFDFLEDMGDGRHRVRGAQRYLRISQARADAGRKGGKRSAIARQEPSNSQAIAQASAKQLPEQNEALSLSTDHRALSIERKATAGPPPPSKLPPETADPTSGPSAFFAYVQEQRAQNGLPREKPPRPEAMSRWWSGALMELNGDAEEIAWAYREFAKDEYWRGKAPPLPFNAFMSQWSKYVRPGPIQRTAN